MRRNYEEDADLLALALQEKPGQYMSQRELAPILGTVNNYRTMGKIIEHAMGKYPQIRKNPAKNGGFCWFGVIPAAKVERDADKAEVKSGAEAPKAEENVKVAVTPVHLSEKQDDTSVERRRARVNASGAADPTAYKAIGHDSPMCGEIWAGRDRNKTGGLFLIMNVHEKTTYVCFSLHESPSFGCARGMFSVSVNATRYYGNANVPLLKKRSSLMHRVGELSIVELTKARSAMAQAFRLNTDLITRSSTGKEIVEVEKVVEKEVPVPMPDEDAKVRIELLEYKVEFLEKIVDKLLT